MAIKAEYKAYMVTMLIVLVVLYLVSHFYKDSTATFGVSYVGAA